MPFAITLRLDPAAAERVSALWAALSTQDISHDSLQLGYSAHLTLAVCPDNTSETRLHSAVAALTSQRALPVTLTNLGIFVGRGAPSRSRSAWW